MCGSVAVEGAGGLGHLLAQQLVAAGEQVLDVQPKLDARVRKAPLCCPLMPDEVFSKSDEVFSARALAAFDEALVTAMTSP